MILGSLWGHFKDTLGGDPKKKNTKFELVVRKKILILYTVSEFRSQGSQGFQAFASPFLRRFGSRTKNHFERSVLDPEAMRTGLCQPRRVPTVLSSA